MRILVTGGAGFIGSHLSDKLLARDHQVLVVDDLSKGPLANIEHNLDHPGFEFVQLDICKEAELLEVGKGVDIVVHLAAAKIPRYESALGTITTNLDGAHAALELARVNEAKFVMASTSDVYGKSPAPRFAEDGDLVIGPSTSRRWSYAVSKLVDEHLALAYQESFGIPVTLLRFFGTYGERQYLNWWGGPQGVFLEAINEDRAIEIHGDGLQTRCFIYVTDLAEGVARAVEREQANGEIVNVGNDEEVSIGRLAELMHQSSGLATPLKLEYKPYASFGGNYEDVLRRVPDLTKMRRVLELDQMVPLDEGLSRLWDWYRGPAGLARRSG